MELTQLWMVFRLTQTDGSAYLVYRCPACGSLIDWRDHDRHLQFHGLTDHDARAELVIAQERYAGVR